MQITTRLVCSFAVVALGGSALAQDLDGDGIADSLEDALAQKFAPRLILCGEVLPAGDEEEYHPSSVLWFLARCYFHSSLFNDSGGLRFNHSGCSDHQILTGGITPTLLKSQTHPMGCGHNDGTAHSGSFALTDFFLQIPNDSNEDTTREGQTNPADWTCYTHVSRSATHPDHYDIQYIWFYPYNGAYLGLVSAHEGDWEHVTVRVASDQNTIAAIHYSAHGTSGNWYYPGQFNLAQEASGEPFTHPDVYSAINSHASYPDEGLHQYETGLFDRTEFGKNAFMTDRLVNIGETDVPFPGQEWMAFSGRWGEIGAGGALDGSGPRGPAQQFWWDMELADGFPQPADHYYVFDKDSHEVPAALGNKKSSIEVAQAEVPAGSTVWLLDGEYEDLQSPEYVVPSGFVFDKPVTWRASVGASVRITAAP